MHVSELVERDEELDRVGIGLVGCDELGGDTLLEVNGDVGRLVGGDERRLGHGPHVIGGETLGSSRIPGHVSKKSMVRV